MFVEVVLFCIVIALLFGYWNVNQIYTIWLKNNIPFEKAQFPYGNIKDVGTTKNIFELTNNLYQRMKKQAPLAGFHVFTNAAVVITDLDVVNKILVTDSHLFMDRGMYVNDGPLSANLFNLDGPKYKAIHSKVMPLFSSEKAKMMFHSVEQLADRLTNYFSDCLEGRAMDMNLQDVFSRYSTDVMGTLFLGTDCNSLQNEKAELSLYSKKYLVKGRERGLKHFFRNTYQATAKQLKMMEIPESVSEFFMRTVKSSIDTRGKTNTKVTDLIDLLIQLKNAGELNESSDEKSGSITVDEAIATAFVLYVAGYETTLTTLTFCLYEMSKTREIQETLRRHIMQVFQHNNDKSNYDTINDIPYLDQVINGA